MNNPGAATGPATEYYRTTLPAGAHWSLRLRRGLTLSLHDLTGFANVGMVFFNPHNLLERYNAPDTLKCQHVFHLTQGNCLYSDMGRIFASIIEDTARAHESICGNSDAALVSKRFGSRDYQRDRNRWHQNGQDAFLVELAKYGLTRTDLPANINWFSRCAIAADGQISLAGASGAPGQSVRLRIEMDTLVLLHTCPHPLDQRDVWPDAPVQVAIGQAPPVDDDDPCLNRCEENGRGFQNNWLYHLGSATS